MSDAWVVHVHREPEWDEYTQQQALAGVVNRRGRCQKCQAVDSWEPVKSEDRTYRRTDGRRFTVTAMRCLGCGSLEIRERDFRKKHAKYEDQEGVLGPEDGVRFVVAEVDPAPDSPAARRRASRP